MPVGTENSGVSLFGDWGFFLEHVAVGINKQAMSGITTDAECFVMVFPDHS